MPQLSVFAVNLSTRPMISTYTIPERRCLASHYNRWTHLPVVAEHLQSMNSEGIEDVAALFEHLSLGRFRYDRPRACLSNCCTLFAGNRLRVVERERKQDEIGRLGMEGRGQPGKESQRDGHEDKSWTFARMVPKQASEHHSSDRKCVKTAW